jgi:alginate O-acetyltransferase complex protein AlgI
MILAMANYIGALCIDRNKNTKKATVALVLDLVFSLGVLAYFKYLGFFCTIIDSVANVFDVIPSVILPVGISFYTFQLISYVIDVYKGDVEAEKKYTNVLLYTSLFHQCIAGPIVRYRDIANDLKERKTGINDMNDGISRFCIGLAKKTILANSCSSILASVLPESLTAIGQSTVVAAWFGGLLYMLQIYLDFSAYSDMAIGLGKMTGFHYKENFNYPYVATSVTNFWRRWHISLSTFFRDYVYIPLGGNRKGIKRQILNMLIVWSLTGLWHGAAYNFILWGLYYFVLLVIEKLFLIRFFEWLPKILSQIIRRCYTFVAVYFGWILFRFTDFEMIKQVLRSMFGLNGNAFTNLETNTLISNNIIFILICIIASTPLIKWLSTRMKTLARKDHIAFTYIYNGLNIIIPVILLFISTFALVGNSYNPFIYFRF